MSAAVTSQFAPRRSNLGKDNSGRTSPVHSPLRGRIGSNTSAGSSKVGGCGSSSKKSQGCGCAGCGASSRTSNATKGPVQRGMGLASEGCHEGTSKMNVLQRAAASIGWGSEGCHEGVHKASVVKGPRSQLGEQTASVGCGAGGGCSGRCGTEGMGSCSTRERGQLVDAGTMGRLPFGWSGRVGSDAPGTVRRPGTTTLPTHRIASSTGGPANTGQAAGNYDLPATGGDCQTNPDTSKIDYDTIDGQFDLDVAFGEDSRYIITKAMAQLLNNIDLVSSFYDQHGVAMSGSCTSDFILGHVRVWPFGTVRRAKFNLDRNLCGAQAYTIRVWLTFDDGQAASCQVTL